MQLNLSRTYLINVQEIENGKKSIVIGECIFMSKLIRLIIYICLFINVSYNIIEKISYGPI